MLVCKIDGVLSDALGENGGAICLLTLLAQNKAKSTQLIEDRN
jgi:hypothetical protein